MRTASNFKSRRDEDECPLNEFLRGHLLFVYVHHSSRAILYLHIDADHLTLS